MTTHNLSSHIARAPAGRSKGAARTKRLVSKYAPSVTPATTITNANSKGRYDPFKDLLMTPARPGATDHERIPSRRPDGLVYRDGKVVAA